MRALMTAGPALERENIAVYNCAFLPIDTPEAFSELLYVLMNGTGSGYSVESRYVNQLPRVPHLVRSPNTIITVEDSKKGWAVATAAVIDSLYEGIIPTVKYHKVRDAGEILKTFGGRASGPDPLRNSINFIIQTFIGAQGRQLTPLECHDICCKIGETVVVGGVRRSALIALFDKDDLAMRQAKAGEWWIDAQHRHIANNSGVYETRPTREEFDHDWKEMVDGASGEPGFHNLYATKEHIRKNCPLRNLEDENGVLLARGANPCHEIALRPYQFCNLSMVTVRPEDTEETIMEKIEVATIFGTMQATLTNFDFLRPVWAETTEEEALLGTTMTGVQDNPLTNIRAQQSDPDAFNARLERFKAHAIETNRLWAQEFGINQSASVTSLKPSGNSGALVGASSGIHAAYAPFYIRRVRQDMNDPLAKFMMNSNFPFEIAEREKNTVIFEFPMKAAETSVSEGEFTAVEAVDYYLSWQRHYTTHMPSCTIHVREHEWDDVADKVYEHFDEIMGISFFPKDENSYIQAPFEECTEAQYNDLLTRMPKDVDWKDLGMYEESDMTSGSQELACVSGVCEI